MYAGFWKRFAAYMLDYLIIYIFSYIIILILIIVMAVAMGASGTGANSEAVKQLIGIAYVVAVLSMSVLIPVLYFTLFEFSPLQATPGKLALSIKVTDMQGKRLGFWHALGRTLGKIVSMMTLYAGHTMAGYTARRQALHDKIANTLVITKDADINNLYTMPKSPWWLIALSIGGVWLPFILFFGIIIGLVSVPQYFKAVEKSKATQAIVVMGNITRAQSVYKTQKNYYSEDIKSLNITQNDASGNAVEGKSFLLENFEITLGSNFVIADRIKKVRRDKEYTLAQCYDTKNICCSGDDWTCKNLKIEAASPAACCPAQSAARNFRDVFPPSFERNTKSQ